MKRLFAIFALLFATSALAVDNIQSCTGASCKVQLVPRDGSAVKATVLTADGVNGRVGIGSTSPTQALDVVGSVSVSGKSNSFGGATYLTTSMAYQMASNCTVSTCPLEVNLGGGIASVTRSGAGAYAVNFTTSFWSPGPGCVINNTDGNARICQFNTSGGSATTVAFSCFTSTTGAATDSRFVIICAGTRQ